MFLPVIEDMNDWLSSHSIHFIALHFIAFNLILVHYHYTNCLLPSSSCQEMLGYCDSIVDTYIGRYRMRRYIQDGG
jgi:hypothetical protein